MKKLHLAGRTYQVEIRSTPGDGTLSVSVDAAPPLLLAPPPGGGSTGNWFHGNRAFRLVLHRGDHGIELSLQGRRFCPEHLSAPKPRELEEGAPGERRPLHGTSLPVLAGLPGRLAEICVTEGEMVDADTVVAVIEVMKSRVPLKAGYHGRVSAIQVEQGRQVAASDTLMLIDTSPEPSAR